MNPQRVTTTLCFGIGVNEPKLLNSTVPTLQFKVEIFDHDNGVICEIPGWRIAGGSMKPPCRRTPQGAYVANVVTKNAFWAEMLESMVRRWQPDYPAVQFPGAGEKIDVRNIAPTGVPA
jgi:hypothetical protein